MTRLSDDAVTRVKTLIDLTEKLTAIFTRENACLAARRPREMAPLQADKARLAAAYAQSIRDIAADRSVVEGADDDLMKHLKSLTKKFERRASEQRALLDGARFAAEGVVRAVADEAGRAASSPGYDGMPSSSPSPASAAIAFNEEA